MRVLLAGYNIDTEVIKDLMKHSPERKDITPETISASYARISRDPRSIEELRKQAREEVESARKSNKAIIFKMGHHSVAEHAVFNFDIIGVSRLTIEEIEHFRLSSFTEKSQRYITLEDDYIIPEEISKSSLKELFIATIQEQNQLYHKLHGKILDHVFKKNPDLAANPKKHNLLDGWAKEDARYITALATTGQLGQTINARNLELLLRRFAGHRLAEVRELGEKLHQLVAEIAPSIILFYKENDYDKNTYQDLKKAADVILQSKGFALNKTEVSLVNYTKDADDVILASLLHTSSPLSFEECFKTIKALGNEQKTDFIKTSFKHMEFYDSVLREFENSSLTFDLVISASCFAQLKRHRMASMTCQDYNPALGVIIPESIIEVGLESEFRKMIKKTEDCYYKIYENLPNIAPYILTNAHQRRVLFQCNVRELYHVSRLREDNHAQWDIRNISSQMSDLAQKVMPLSLLLIGGKDQYSALYNNLFGTLPKVLEGAV